MASGKCRQQTAVVQSSHAASTHFPSSQRTRSDDLLSSLPYHGTDVTYVHRVRSGAEPLAFLGVENALPRPAALPAAPVGRPSGRLLDAESFGFATAQRLRLAPGERVSVPYGPGARPAARMLVVMSGPPLRCVEVESGEVAVDCINERFEHGQRVGGIAVLYPVGAESVAGLFCSIANASAGEVLEGVVCDVF